MINTNFANGTLTVSFDGKMDGANLGAIEQAAAPKAGISTLVLDLAEVKFISREGMSLLLSLKKRMITRGELKLKNVAMPVYDALDNEGLTTLLNIERMAN